MILTITKKKKTYFGEINRRPKCRASFKGIFTNDRCFHLNINTNQALRQILVQQRRLLLTVVLQFICLYVYIQSTIHNPSIHRDPQSQMLEEEKTKYNSKKTNNNKKSFHDPIMTCLAFLVELYGVLPLNLSIL